MQLVYPDRIQIVLFSLATIILTSQVTELRHVECKKNVHVIQLQNGGPGEPNPIWIPGASSLLYKAPCRIHHKGLFIDA